MSNNLWRAMWKQDKIAFHQTEINPLLEEFLPKLALPKSSRILVPLCGKSLDMNLLADSGHHVIGIELSSIAVKGYFEALKVTPSKERIGCFTRWHYQKTEIWCGDIFDLTAQHINRYSVLYDCASLTAFPAERRPEYIRYFRQRLPADSQIILVTTESMEETNGGSEHRIDSEVTTLYQKYYDIQLLHGRSCLKQDPEDPNAEHQVMNEKIYQITRRSILN